MAGWDYETDGLVDGFDSFGETGLMHVGARYYAPALGRFAQRDLIAIAAGPNVYQYSSANPLSFVDPTGAVDFTATGTFVASTIQAVMQTAGIAILRVGSATLGAVSGISEVGTIITITASTGTLQILANGAYSVSCVAQRITVHP